MEFGGNKKDDVYVSEDYKKFMEKVDTISSILRGMKSEDPDVAKFSMKRAEEYLKDMKEDYRDIDEELLKIKSDRTVVNKKPESDKITDPETMDMNAFMASVESDANQRAEDRRLRKEVSDRFKRQGNQAFREGNYEKAVELYSKAIDEIRDSAVLYNNRALTYLKLGLYKRALTDSETALQINKFSIKAKAYKALALFMRGEVKESNAVIAQACKDHPEQEAFFKEYQASWPKEEDDFDLESGGRLDTRSSFVGDNLEKEMTGEIGVSPRAMTDSSGSNEMQGGWTSATEGGCRSDTETVSDGEGPDIFI